MALPVDPVMGPEVDIEGGESDALLPVAVGRGKTEPLPQPATSTTNSMPDTNSSEPVEEKSTTTANNVPVPLEMLQKIVDFCAQTLRETSDSKRILQDLERGECGVRVSKEAEQLQRPQGNISVQTRGNMFKLSKYIPPPMLRKGHDQFRMLDWTQLEEVWNEVTPWSLDEFLSGFDLGNAERKPNTQEPPAPNLAANFEESLARYPLFMEAMDGDPNWHRVYLHFLKLRMGDTLVRVGLLVACCLWSLDRVPKTFGSLLRGCYHQGLFQRPKALDSRESLELLVAQILQLTKCFLLLNNIYRISERTAYTHTLPWATFLRGKVTSIIINGPSIQQLLGIEVSQFLHIFGFKLSKNGRLESSRGDTLRIDDLDIRSLTSIGRLSIEWTEILEDHLRLNFPDRTLSVVYDYLVPKVGGPIGSWQHLQVIDLPKKFMDSISLPGCIDRSMPRRIDDEIAQSWGMLFGIGGSAKKRSAVHDQFAPLIGLPDALERYLRNQQINSILPHNATKLETIYEGVAEASRNKDTILYTQFPVFETRLRQLRYYMDSQQPRGLRQLWKDNRDSLNSYTFWGVIVFRGLSVLLAVFSLAVSIAQTVASF